MKMKHLTKPIRLVALTILMVLITGCPPPDDDVFFEDETVALGLDLLLTVETQEDQIGAIASNAMAIFHDEVWSVGGNRPGTPVDKSDVWNSTNGTTWVSVTDAAFEGMSESKMINYDNKLWVIGGRNGDGDPLGEVWSSDDGFTWNLVTDSPAFNAAVNHDMVVFNSRMFLIARRLDLPNQVSVWSSTNGEDWDLEAENAFSGREEFTAVVFNGALYVLGGFDPTDGALPVNNEIWTSTNGNTWNQLETNSIFQARYAHTATVYNNKVFVAGGIGRISSSLSILGNLWYSEDMINWFEYEPFTSDIGITDHSALVFDDKLWLFFGFEGADFPDGAATGKIRSITEE